MYIDDHIEKLFKRYWVGDYVLSSIDNMREQLLITLEGQVNAYWCGSSAYKIAVNGGFLKDGKSCTNKELTVLGESFLVDMSKLTKDET